MASASWSMASPPSLETIGVKSTPTRHHTLNPRVTVEFPCPPVVAATSLTRRQQSIHARVTKRTSRGSMAHPASLSSLLLSFRLLWPASSAGTSTATGTASLDRSAWERTRRLSTATSPGSSTPSSPCPPSQQLWSPCPSWYPAWLAWQAALLGGSARGAMAAGSQEAPGGSRRATALRVDEAITRLWMMKASSLVRRAMRRCKGKKERGKRGTTGYMGSV